MTYTRKAFQDLVGNTSEDAEERTTNSQIGMNVTNPSRETQRLNTHSASGELKKEELNSMTMSFFSCLEFQSKSRLTQELFHL
jgi:hypothetical protein